MKYTIVGIVLVLLDRITKVLAVKTPFSSLMVNENLAFSLPLSTKLLTTGTIVLSIIIVLFCIWLIYTHKNTYTVGKITSLGLIIIGATSNIYDRIAYGGVIDFINIGLYFVFNVADVYIVIGVILALLSFKMSEPEIRNSKSDFELQ